VGLIQDILNKLISDHRPNPPKQLLDLSSDDDSGDCISLKSFIEINPFFLSSGPILDLAFHYLLFILIFTSTSVFS